MDTGEIIESMIKNCKGGNFIACRRSNSSEQLNKLCEILETDKSIRIFQLNYQKFAFKEEEAQSFSRTLQRNSSIKKLHLHGEMNKMVAKYMQKGLKKNNSIKTLYLECPVEDDAMYYLAKIFRMNKKIERFSLSEGRLSSKGMKYLSDSLLHNPTLKILALDHNRLGGSLYGMTELLKCNEKVEILSLIDNELNNDDLSWLSEALRSNRGLKKLYLGLNSFSAEGLSCLSKSLQVNSHLQELSMSGGSLDQQISPYPFKNINKFSNPSSFKMHSQSPLYGQYFSEILLNNRSLTTLDLSYSGITDQPMKQLSEAISVNKTLTTLNLDSNQLTDESIQFLHQSLASNNTLTSLFLKDNLISDLGADLLLKALHSNTSLVKISLGLRINENGELFQLLPTLDNDQFKDIFLQIKDLTSNSTISPEKSDKINYFLKCNIPWNPNVHHTVKNDFFHSSIFSFLLSLKKNKHNIKLPRPIIYEIISKVDRKAFYATCKKRKRDD